jgi:uncharacterized protein
VKADNSNDTLLKFPCQFPVKAMGKSGPELESAIMEIVARHVPELSAGDVKFVASKKGTYTSITITISAQSKQQLDSIYQDLTACEHVLYAL